jgi:hypothetical protein
MNASADSSVSRWFILQRSVWEHTIGRALDVFRENKIEPIVFKGWAAARYYPASRPRRMSDVDLAVSAADYASATRLIKSDELRTINIDLHREFRHLDTLSWNDLFTESRIVEAGNARIRVLRPEDHLRVLCTHWLTDGGGRLDRLWDIYYLIDNEKRTFDWDRCLNVVPEHRRRWVVCTIGLTHKYLGMPIDDLPIANEAREIPEWVGKCVEKEWAIHSSPIQPVLVSLYDRRILFDQLRRRLPPNPLRAMVESEGDIDSPIQFGNQLRVLGRRAMPFARDACEYLFRRITDAWNRPSKNH